MSQDVGKLRCQIAKVPLYMYNVGKYQIHLHLLRNRTEKLARLLFYLFLKLVQINYIFSDNVCTCMYIVYLFTQGQCYTMQVPLSTIFHVYYGNQFYQWMKPEYQVNTTVYKPLALYFIAIKVVSSNLLMILVIGTDWIET